MHHVYVIQNLSTMQVYVGETSRENPEIRWNEHQNSLRLGKHPNGYLQQSWNKYSKDSFEWYILDSYETEEEALYYEEVYRLWYKNIQYTSWQVIDLTYNLTECGGKPPSWLGKKRPPMTDSHKEKLSETMFKTGSQPWNKGGTLSEESKNKIRLARSKQVFPENYAETMSRVKQGKSIGGKEYYAFGESKTVVQWSQDPRCVVCVGTIVSRLKLGWDVEETIIRPAIKGRNQHWKPGE